MEYLETSRVTCVKFNLDDSDSSFIIQLLNDKAWIDNIGDRNIHSMLEAKSYLQNGPLHLYDTHGYGPLKVILKETGVAIGMAGLFRREALDNLDLVI